MAWSFVQSKVSQGGTSLTFDSSTTANSLIIVAANCAATFVTSVADGHSNSYSVPIHITSGLGRLFLAYAVNSSGGSLTVTMTTNAGDRCFAIHEYTGLAATSPLDSSASTANGTGGSQSSGTCTVSQSGELLFGAWSIWNSGGFSSTAGTGFTQRVNTWSGGTWCGLATEDKTSSSSAAATFTGTSATWGCGAMSFKLASSGAVSAASWGLKV